MKLNVLNLTIYLYLIMFEGNDQKVMNKSTNFKLYHIF